MKVLLLFALVGAVVGKAWNPLEISLKALSTKSLSRRQVVPECGGEVGEFLDEVVTALEEFVPQEIKDAIVEALDATSTDGLRCVPTVQIEHTLNILNTVVLIEDDWTDLELLHCFAHAAKAGLELELSTRADASPAEPPTIRDVLANLPEDCPTPLLRPKDNMPYPTCICEHLIEEALELVTAVLGAEEEADDIDWEQLTLDALQGLGDAHLCAAKMAAGTYMATIIALTDVLGEPEDAETCDLVGFVPHTICYAGFVADKIDELLSDPDLCPLRAELAPPPRGSLRPRPRVGKQVDGKASDKKRIYDLVSRLLKK